MNGKINVNPKNLPPYLSEQLFDRWVDNFLLGNASTLAPQLHVVFSPKEKKDVYGVLSLEEAKERIGALAPLKEGTKKDFEGILSTIETKEDLLEMAGCLAKCLAPENENERETISERIKEIAAIVKFCVLRLGEYCHGKREIVLYTNSILRTCYGKTNEQAFEEVFAHELFHAYHFFYLHGGGKDGDILCRTDETKRVVLESLASYYEAEYCKTYRIPTDLARLWKREEAAIYPYAGAKYIDSSAKFEEIFKSSSDLDGALRTLLCKDEEGREQFYKIKNGYQGGICEKKASVVSVTEYCRASLGAEFSTGPKYFITKKMCEFFARHGEEIGDKMRIVCQEEDGKIALFLDIKGTQRSSAALDLLCSDSGFRVFCPKERTADSFRAIRRTIVIGLDEWKNAAGAPRPFSAVVSMIDANLQPFRDKLFELETLLDTL